MRSIIEICKTSLPPKLSFRLRCLKARYADPDTVILQALSRHFGGKKIAAVDVGANVGIYSDLLASSFHKVISVEPNPVCYLYLREVLPANCEVIQCAASDVDGRSIMRVPKSSDGSLQTTRSTISDMNSLDGWSTENVSAIDVETKSLDHILADAQIKECIRLLKIDVEGHEFSVLRGASKTIETNKPAIYIELERRHGCDPTIVLKWLKERDYEIMKYEEGTFKPDPSFTRDNKYQDDQIGSIWNYVLFHNSDIRP